MTEYDWRLRGLEVNTCNCSWGCPCQFNSLPTHGNCRAVGAMHIDDGYFGDIRLDGLRWAVLFAWPGAVHEGNGECLPIVDERADTRQRDALLQILSGETSEPGATHFSVFASTMSKTHEPIVAPIEFEADYEAGTGRISIPGVVEATASPIRNPVDGSVHRARVQLVGGFEYKEAEFVGGSATSVSAIPLRWDEGHGHIVRMDITPSGPLA